MIKAIFFLEPLSEEKLQDCLGLGINTVFIGHKNLHKEWIEKFHKKNIKVFAEVGLFVGEELWQKYPGSQPAGNNEKLIKKIDGYAGVCPNHPKVRKEKLLFYFDFYFIFKKTYIF